MLTLSNNLAIEILLGAVLLLNVEAGAKCKSSVRKLSRGSGPKYSAAFDNSETFSGKQLFFVNVTNWNDYKVLPCGADKVEQFRKVSWKKDNNDIAQSYDKNMCSLLVRNLNLADSATYSCEICNWTACSTSNVKLVVSSEKIFCNQTVPAGSDAIFCCFIPFAYNYFYYETVVRKMDAVGNKEVVSRNSSEKQNYFHEIKSVTKQDEGWYSCVVRDPSDGTVIVNENAYLKVFESNQKITESNQETSGIALIIISTVVVVLIVIMISLSVWWFRKKIKIEYDEQKIKQDTVSHKSSYGSPKGFQKLTVPIMMLRNKKNPAKVFKYKKRSFDSEWEFPRNQLVLGKMLGKGVFGKVFAATVSGLVEESASSVAVKMLNDEHSNQDVKDLLHELEVMKMVGRHRNIINLLGCCSKDGPLYVIVDYAAHGNLQSFLRKHRFESDIDQNDKLVINQNQLLSFVAQIASGMEYLASNDCVHRNLKARNVLVCEGYTMKITDYGRDVYKLDRFTKTSSGMLPIQWMAPESLLEYTFDEKSDVWSFGVTFWEVMTIGGYPLPEFADCEQLIEWLKQGNRLEQPKSCSDEVYLAMSNCWQWNSVVRPTFSEIVKQLLQLAHTVLLDGYSNVHDEWDSNSYTYVVCDLS